LTVITEKADPSLVTQGWVGDKPCLVTVDTGAFVTVVRPDIATGWPERQPNQHFKLQTVSGEALPILKEVFLTLTLGRRPLKIWVFFANITEFILGLDILRAYDASVDIGRQTLLLAEEEIPLWSPGVEPRPSSLVVAKEQVITAQCIGTTSEETESRAGHREVPKVKGRKKRHRGRKRCGEPKELAREICGSHKELADASRKMTRHAGVA
jgi:hypothetical protein